MENFSYQNPVNLVFGKGSIAQLRELVPPSCKVILTYGGGSIMRNGVHAQVMEALRGRQVVEFGGIEPNPFHETCMKAVELAKAEKVDFLLAVGGGSVLDATKYIAAAIRFDGGDAWDILEKQAPVKAALPLGAVLTLPATGSEMNANSVVSKKATQQKLYFGSPLVYPKFSILDPETTYSLPTRQTVNGVVDAFVHVMEQYMTRNVNAALQDRQAEAVLVTLIEQASKVLASPNDYDARANVMYCATCALNGTLALGQVSDWSTHMLGHELTAFFGLDHAQSLAVVMPSLWRHELEHKRAKLEQFGERVFGVQGAEAAIRATEDFFHAIGMKTKLADYGVAPAEAAKKVSERFAERKLVFGENADIDAVKTAAILRDC